MGVATACDTVRALAPGIRGADFDHRRSDLRVLVDGEHRKSDDTHDDNQYRDDSENTGLSIKKLTFIMFFYLECVTSLLLQGFFRLFVFCGITDFDFHARI